MLNNCNEVKPFIGYVSRHAMIELQLFRANFEMVLFCRVFKNELKAEGVSNEAIDRRIVKEFCHWFKLHVSFPLFCN